MSFTSVGFWLFLGLVVALTRIVPAAARKTALLIANMAFYFLVCRTYVVALAVYAVALYLAARGIHDCRPAWARATLAFFSCTALLLILLVSKYADAITGGRWSIVAPVGVSYLTFSGLGYLIDVRRGTMTPAENWIDVVIYMTFFPKIVAGPIERARDFLPQLNALKRATASQTLSGITRISVGILRKTVIADTIAPWVDVVFDAGGIHNAPACAVAVGLYTLQIYMDFAGYTDIAIGASQLMGFTLTENFNCPYSAYSIRDFWSRWHITLSHFLREYVYIPLGGNRKGALRTALNTLTTFALSGLWHGANLTYLLWGAWHGVYQVVENRLFPKKPAPPRGWARLIRQGLTLFLVAFAWIFFRAATLSDALSLLRHLITGPWNVAAWSAVPAQLSISMAPAMMVGFASFITGPLRQQADRQLQRASDRPRRASILLTSVLTLLLAACAWKLQQDAGGATSAFIYFQF